MKCFLRTLVITIVANCTAHVYAVFDNDLATDYSNAENTASSIWSYRYQQGGLTRDGNYELMGVNNPTTTNNIGVAFTPGPNPQIWQVTPNNTPWLGKNEGAVSQSYLGQINWAPGEILAHPNAAELVVVSWLSSTTTTVDVSYSFADRHPQCGDGIQWFVDKNDTTLPGGSGSYAGGGSSGPLATITGVSVDPGDRINFIINPGPAGHSCDSTAISARVTEAVPEPASIIALLVGLPTLFLIERRRRRFSVR